MGRPSAQWAMMQFLRRDKEGGGNSCVLKAVVGGGGVEGGEGEAVGFAIVKVVGGEGGGDVMASEGMGGGRSRDRASEEEAGGRDVEGGSADGTTQGGEGDTREILNADFCGVYLPRMKEIYERHMGGRRHVCMSSLLATAAFSLRRRPFPVWFLQDGWTWSII